jgi:adenine-specific DNA glycosylase
MSYTMNKKQMEEFLNNIVVTFSGKDFTIDDIKGMDTFMKPKKNKKVKDPKAPKRGLSAWIIFTNEQRPIFKENNPESSTTELTTLMSQEWKNMTDEDKKKYTDLAVVDKQRYMKEMEEYDTSDSENEKPIKAKKEKDTNAPKKNQNSWMHFCKVTRAKHPDVKHTVAALKVMWADLDDKSEYEIMAKLDKERYLKEKKEYLDNQ